MPSCVKCGIEFEVDRSKGGRTPLTCERHRGKPGRAQTREEASRSNAKRRSNSRLRDAEETNRPALELLMVATTAAAAPLTLPPEAILAACGIPIPEDGAAGMVARARATYGALSISEAQGLLMGALTASSLRMAATGSVRDSTNAIERVAKARAVLDSGGGGQSFTPLSMAITGPNGERIVLGE